jgi:hypothetical protein
MIKRTTRRRFAHRAGLMLAALVGAAALPLSASAEAISSPITAARFSITIDSVEPAWPSKLEIGALTAGASTITLETVTIVAEQIERVPA